MVDLYTGPEHDLWIVMTKEISLLLNISICLILKHSVLFHGNSSFLLIYRYNHYSLNRKSKQYEINHILDRKKIHRSASVTNAPISITLISDASTFLSSDWFSLTLSNSPLSCFLILSVRFLQNCLKVSHPFLYSSAE